ncbi:hypothetical protein [Thalassobaculum litoreum]|uniref:hypothetical protein n=1 Tax=Thalassobaculum litoreum TaxID=420996 RepID=UPI001FDF2105|nr:hypothetical protein [Thalassobaculum litoreum]
MAASIATHEAAQHEIVADILAGRGKRAAIQPVLRLLPDRDADERFMLSALHVNAETRRVNEPGIERITQQIEGPLPVGAAQLLGTELLIGVEEAGHFRR